MPMPQQFDLGPEQVDLLLEVDHGRVGGQVAHADIVRRPPRPRPEWRTLNDTDGGTHRTPSGSRAVENPAAPERTTQHDRGMSDDVVAIRPEAPGDEEAIDAVVREAFMRQFGSDSEVGLVRTLRSRGELVPELTLVATIDGHIVGFIAFSEVTLDGERAGGLGLAPVAVAPDRQGLGIGGALIRAGLERATDTGWRFVVLLGHDHYYPRFGFAPAAPAGVQGDYGEGASWMARPLGDHELVPGHVRYCSAFRD